ncbi:hypothetical protein HDU93_000211 [Gonapodya sp. JEL0774]|nr:hypothetical protein HDU93_000211 [Gonapodya sp. JEL0774]
MTPKRFFAAVDATDDPLINDVGSQQSDSFSVQMEPKRAPDYQMSVKFRAKCCRSLLTVDVAGKGLQFQDCVAGSVSYFRDFTVTNKSEITLFWSINLIDLDNRHDRIAWFKFTDYDSMLDEIRPGEAQKPIPAYSHRRVRVTFKPRLVGEHKLLLEVENVRDSRNIDQLPVRAWVKDRSQADIIALSAQALDFGDCVAGMWARQTLAVRNPTEAPLDVHFEAEQVGQTGQVMVTLQFEGLGSSKIDHRSIEHIGNWNTVDFDAAVMRANKNISTSERDIERSLHEDRDENRLPGSGPGDCLDRNISQLDESRARIEDLHLAPISDRVVEIWYRAEPEPTGNRLTRRAFTMVLSTTSMRDPSLKERKLIHCKARACTSLIEVSPRELHFGESDLNMLKGLPIFVRNRSDVTAYVELQFVSKVLSGPVGPVEVPPQQTEAIRLEIFPRKPNPEYRKQVTVVNLRNPSDRHTLEVKAQNVDRHRITFHSLFYRLVTPMGANFLDFGLVRPCGDGYGLTTEGFIQILIDGDLALALSSSGPELTLWEVPSNPRAVVSIRDQAAMQEQTQLINGAAVTALDPREASESAVDLSPLSINSVADEGASSRRERAESFLESVADNRSRNIAKLAALPTVSRGALMKRKKATSSIAWLDLARVRRPKQTTVAPEIVELRNKHGFDGNDRGISGASTQGIQWDSSHRTNARLDSTLMDGSRKAISNLADPTVTMVGTYPSKPIDVVLAQYESVVGGSLPVFPNGSSEEQYARLLISLRRDLGQALEQKILVPLTHVTLGARQTRRIVLMLNATGRPSADHSKAKQRKDFKLLVRMVRFRKGITADGFEQFIHGDHPPPVRELLVRSNVTRSSIDLGQLHFNFGAIERGQKRQKTIVLFNRCEVPAIFAIRRSGSISSADLVVAPDGRYGIIRSFGRREITFEFSPSLAGSFQERLIVENVLDSEDSHAFLVKAFVKKPPNFALETEHLDFGLCNLNEASQSQTLTVTNTSHKARVFEIYSDPRELSFESYTVELRFEEVTETTTQGFSSTKGVHNLTPTQLEELETLQQKHKIAERKGQSDKVQLISAKIELIRSGRVDEKFSEEGIEKREDDVVTKQPTVQLKRTPYGILKEVEPRGAWTVHVFFQAVANPQAKTGRLIRRTFLSLTDSCQGTVYVRERRNADEEKRVGFRATVRFPRWGEYSTRPLHQSQQVVTAPLAEDLAAASNLGSITLVAPTVDLKRLEVHQRKDAYFTLRNDRKVHLDWELLLHDIPTECTFAETSGNIEPGESKRVDFVLVPNVVGPKTFALSIYSWPSSSISTVSFHYHAVLGSYLAFPDFPSNELDFGVCYADPTKRFSKSMRLRISNISNDDVAVSVVSNLTQLLVFEDANLEFQAQEFKIRAAKDAEVYVAFQPKQMTDREIAGERSVVGGLRFSVVLADTQINDIGEAFVVGNQTLRFSAIVGESRIALDSTIIDFGRSKNPGNAFKGLFKIANISKLPASWCAESETEELTLSSTFGELQPTNDKEPLSSSSSVEVTFKPLTFGFHRPSIIIRNVHNSLQVLLVEIRLFVDPGLMTATPFGVPSSATDTSDRLSPQLISMVDFNFVYIRSSPSADESFFLEIDDDAPPSKRPGKTVEFQSAVDQVLNLAPFSDLKITCEAQQPMQPSHGENNHEAFLNQSESLPLLRPCGASMTLESRGRLVVRLTPPHPENLTAEQIQMLLGGKSVSVSGIFALFDKESGMIVQVVGLQALWGVSLSKIEPSIIDLGLLHASRLSEVPFTFTIRNKSDLPLVYELLKSDAVRFLDGVERGTIVSSSSANVHACLVLGNLGSDLSGPQEMEIKLRNERNSRSTTTLRLLYSVASLQIQLDRLVDGEIVLPRLTYPVAPPESPPCDSWFSVRNLADHETRFSVEVLYSPAVERILKIDLLWRATNAPLTGPVSIPARGSADIRVRAIPIAPEVDGTNKEGIFDFPPSLTFGKAVLRVHHSDGDLSQDVTIRGSIFAGPKFGVSHTSVVFLATHDVSDGSGDEFDFNNLASDDRVRKPEQRKSRKRRATGSITETDQTARVTITNFNPMTSITLQVLIQNPPELRDQICLRIRPLGEDMRGSVPPGGRLELVLEWLGANVSGLSQPILVSLIEVKPMGKAQEITIAVNVAGPTAVIADTGSGNEVDNASEVDSLIQPVDFLDDISAVSIPSMKGRVVAGTELADESEFVVRSGMKRIESVQYHAEIDGFYELNAGQQDEGTTTTRKIVLDCVAPQRVVYRLWTHDTLARLPESDVFDVSVNGFAEECSEIVMRDLFYETEYATRSIVIRNLDTSTLEFTLTSDLPSDDPNGPPAQTFQQANISEEKKIAVFVNCRSVRDHQKTVTVIAHIKRPQMKLTKREIIFRGRLTRTGVDLTDKEGEILKLENILEDDLEYEVIDETAFFSIENLDVPHASWSSSAVLRASRACGATVPSHLFNRLRIRPDHEAIARYADVLQREKYVFEHFSIINKRRPTERFWITVRLTFGRFGEFHVASMSQPTFSILQENVFRLVCDAHANVDSFAHALVSTESSEASRVRHLLVRCQYLVDELVFLGTREQAGESCLILGNLLFKSLFAIRAFTEDPALDDTVDVRNEMLGEWSLRYACFNTISGHVLVLPQRVALRLSDLSQEEVKDLFLSVQRIGEQIESEYSGDSLTIAIQTTEYCTCSPRHAGDYKNNDNIYDDIQRTSREYSIASRDRSISDHHAGVSGIPNIVKSFQASIAGEAGTEDLKEEGRGTRLVPQTLPGDRVPTQSVDFEERPARTLDEMAREASRLRKLFDPYENIWEV